jgi:ABC-type xylose transport system permease subunit
MTRRAMAVVGTLLAGVAWIAVPGRAVSPTPSPSRTAGLGSTGGGPGFVVLAVIIVAALLFSTWRLRRDR